MFLPKYPNGMRFCSDLARLLGHLIGSCSSDFGVANKVPCLSKDFCFPLLLSATLYYSSAPPVVQYYGALAPALLYVCLELRNICINLKVTPKSGFNSICKKTISCDLWLLRWEKCFASNFNEVLKCMSQSHIPKDAKFILAFDPSSPKGEQWEAVPRPQIIG